MGSHFIYNRRMLRSAPVNSSRLSLGVFAKVASAVFLFAACGDDSGLADEGAVTDSGTSDTQTSTADDGSDDGSDSSDSGQPATEIHARGIRITAVEANQGVGVNIASDGVWVDGASRNSPLLGGRDTLVRAYWEYDADWTPREIEARLTLYPPDAEPYTRTRRTFVEQESSGKYIDRSWYFSIPEDEAVEGLKFQVSLFEVDESFGSLPEPETPPVSPLAGENWVGFEEQPMQLKIHVVPFISAWSGCNREPDTSDAVRARFEEIMLQRNALHEVDITWESPETITFQVNSFNQLFPYLDDRRVANGLLPNVYYYGLIDACTGDLSGAGGLAMTIPGDSMEAGFQRISAGLSLGLDWTSTTFVHEVGHTQGLMHAYCASNPNDGPDPNFPHDDARIGAWGFGIKDFIIRDRDNARDYMSYCYNGSWASDYHWWKTYNRIRTLTSWETGGDHQEPTTQSVLVSLVDGDGRVTSYVTEGVIDDSFGEHQAVEVETHAGRLRLNGQSRVQPDGDGRVVVAPWPGLEGEALELVLPGLGRAVGPELDRLHN